MRGRLSRRTALSGMGVLALAAAAPARAGRDVSGDLAALERRLGGQIGLAALDLNDGARVGYRSDERFPLVATVTFMAAAFALARSDRGDDDLERRILFDESSVVANSPVTRARVHGQGMSVAELCEAAIVQNDATATSLLFENFGGPGALEGALRAAGDEVTRIERANVSLGDARPGDPQNTTSPAAFLDYLQRTLTENALKPPSRDRLIGWLVRDPTGSGRFRAGVPKTWQVAERGATGLNGTSSGLALCWPPGRSPVLIAGFAAGSRSSVLQLNDGFAAMGRAVAAGFAQGS